MESIEHLESALQHHEQGHDRYAAFGLRIKQLFAIKAKVGLAKAKQAALANARYTAYSSDVGEAFRPMVPEWAVRATYGLAITYIAGDVGMTTYKESQKPGATQEKTLRAFLHATIFQGVASLALPMVIIHQTVHAAQAITKRMKRFTKWGPTLAGLALIPALPYAVDEPCEHAIEYVFDKAWPVEGEKPHGQSEGADAEKQAPSH